MKLILAQGNPGPQYEKTRHNVGFITLDSLAESLGGTWKLETKYRSLIAQVIIGGEKILLVKPQTFYNDTGLSARGLVDFYKLNPADDVLAIHDDLALPFGTVRVRQSGSDAGNNGIRSLNAHLGQDYWRIRVGIWNDLRERINDADFVLSRFTSGESEELNKLIPTVITPLIESFISGDIENTSLHTKDQK